MGDSIAKWALGYVGSDVTRHLLSGLQARPLNILVTGEVGSGKSSTINAMLGSDDAPTGEGAEPVTSEITKYELDSMTLWDTPGFGNGRSQDQENATAITAKLKELGEDGAPLIDGVLVVVDSTSRSLGTVYDVLEIIVPCIGEYADTRIVIALNKVDLLSREWGNCWGLYESYARYGRIGPDGSDRNRLLQCLSDTIKTIKARIKDSVDIDIDPICYSARSITIKDSNGPYNLEEVYARLLLMNLGFVRPAMGALAKIDPARSEQK